MNDRNQAIEILKQAREVLLTRLAERVVDSREDILDDASGYSYTGAIESVHDQLGQRLCNVSTLLAHLQTTDDGAPYDAAPPEMLTVVPEVEGMFDSDADSSRADAFARPSAREDVGLDGRLDSAEQGARSRPPAPSGASRHPADWREVEWRDDDSRALGAQSTRTAPRKRPVEASECGDQAPPQSADAGYRDHVFQETDFRGDLLGGDLDVLNPPESTAADGPAAD